MGAPDNLMIGFAATLSIGYLDVETMKLTRINNVKQNHFIFETIRSPFDWYYHESIMIIPDPAPVPRKNWNSNIYVCQQNIECNGKFIAFFHFKKYDGNMNYATSLTLPEFEHINNELNIH